MAAQGENFVADPNNPHKVILTKFSLLVEGRDEVSIDLTESKEEHEEPFIMKEGTSYKIKIYFYVQRDIVLGLRYHHRVENSGISVDKFTDMMGSYGPNRELQSYISTEQEAPKGLSRRRLYTFSSKVVDDDKIVLGTWKWHLDVKGDW